MISVSMAFLRDGMVMELQTGPLEQLRLALNEVAKYVALELVGKLYLRGKIERAELGWKWLEMAQDLAKAWIREIVMSLIMQ